MSFQGVGTRVGFRAFRSKLFLGGGLEGFKF